MIKNIFVIVILFIFLSCNKNENNYQIVENSDGVKTYLNKNIPSNKSFTMKTHKLFTIKGVDKTNTDSSRIMLNPSVLKTDSSKNIYILDRKGCSIKKFTKDGTFITSFGNKGSGPGEMIDPVDITILRDTIFIYDYSSHKIVKFDNSGNFIEFVNLDNIYPMFLYTLSNDNMICMSSSPRMVNDKELFFDNNLMIINNKFEKIKIIKRNSIKYEPKNIDLSDFNFRFTLSHNKIYVGEISTNEYLITVYDLNGNVLYRIKKNYTNVPFSKEKQAEYSKIITANNEELGKTNISTKYKKAIKDMYYDKYGNLIIYTSIKRNNKNKKDYVVDVFKDGVFINRIILDICEGDEFRNSNHKLFFEDRRIFYINKEDNTITIYNY